VTDCCLNLFIPSPYLLSYLVRRADMVGTGTHLCIQRAIAISDKTRKKF
jgi:hypothetical protein